MTTETAQTAHLQQGTDNPDTGQEIGPGTVTAFLYDLYDGDGNRIESRRDAKPVLFLFGDRSMLATLQDAFRGKCAGDEFSTSIPHGQAYGRRYPDRTRRVSRKQFKNGKTHAFRIGEMVTVTEQGAKRSARVSKVGKFHIDVDLNHPLAGVDLTFDISIVSVRMASAEEIAHGHAHGPGGHQH